MPEQNLIRLRDRAAEAFEKTLAALLGKPVSVLATRDHASSADTPGTILRQQILSISPDPVAWVAAPEATWKNLSTEVLIGAGLDEVLEEDQRSTWLEVTQQGFGGLASAISAELKREVTWKIAEDVPQLPPEGGEWMVLEISYEGGNYWMEVAFAQELVRLYDSTSGVDEADKQPKQLRGTEVSKTFDLLLDVALPLSVSFGRTSLQLREVLKLNTGSIVELDRFVTEPVDVIVNDCVIARGDVVVVEGNYGVRIRQISSREDRLRSGFNEFSSVTSRKP